MNDFKVIQNGFLICSVFHNCILEMLRQEKETLVSIFLMGMWMQKSRIEALEGAIDFGNKNTLVAFILLLCSV